MPLRPSIVERINRARADLRMGVPVVLTGQGPGGHEVGALVVGAEVLDTARLAELRLLGGTPVLAVTAHRRRR